MTDDAVERVVDDYGSAEKALDELDEMYGEASSAVRQIAGIQTYLEEHLTECYESREELEEIREEIESRRKPGTIDLLQRVDDAIDDWTDEIELGEEALDELEDLHSRAFDNYCRLQRLREAIRDEY